MKSKFVVNFQGFARSFEKVLRMHVGKVNGNEDFGSSKAKFAFFSPLNVEKTKTTPFDAPLLDEAVSFRARKVS